MRSRRSHQASASASSRTSSAEAFDQPMLDCRAPRQGGLATRQQAAATQARNAKGDRKYMLVQSG